ncbi:MAG: hypothetical protein ACTSUM_01625 [Alphaproteobacteria bacterium]
MKKLLFAMAIVFSTGAMAQIEPNYADMTDVIKSFKSLADSCQTTNPYCTTVCSNGIKLSMSMDNGGNITSHQREALKKQWMKCYKALYGS